LPPYKEEFRLSLSRKLYPL